MDSLKICAINTLINYTRYDKTYLFIYSKQIKEFLAAKKCYNTLCTKQFSAYIKGDKIKLTSVGMVRKDVNTIETFSNEKFCPKEFDYYCYECFMIWKSKKTDIPIFFHNLSGYDSHLFIKSLFPCTINIIAKSTQKYNLVCVKPHFYIVKTHLKSFLQKQIRYSVTKTDKVINFIRNHEYLNWTEINDNLYDFLIFNPHYIITKAKYNSLDDAKKKFYIEFDGIKFCDSLSFMNSSLDSLISKLPIQNCNFTKISKKLTKSFPPQTNLSSFNSLIGKKMKFPYELAKDIQDYFFTTSMPLPSDFYSSISGETITMEEWKITKSIWDEFKIQRLSDFLQLYLIIDVYSLANVFENFRSKMFTMYGLDPANYVSTPSYAWDCALKFSNVKLDTITDASIYEFFSNGIRGGVSSVGYIRCLDLENKNNVDFYPPFDTQSKIKYYDVNNLYGYCMKEPLPVGDFTWLKKEELKILKNRLRDPAQHEILLNENKENKKGFIIMVDLIYPKELHNFHIDYPLAPEHYNNRLCLTLFDKKEYICYIKILILYMKLGIKIKRLKAAVSFREEAWLDGFIEKNTLERNKAKENGDTATADLFKLMNVSVYGKTMENVKKRIDFKLVNNNSELEEARKRFDLQRVIKFNKNLIGFKYCKKKILINKPIYLGFTILELAKLTTYSLFYGKISSNFKSEVINGELVVSKPHHLLYTDTDSFIIYFGNYLPHNYPNSLEDFKNSRLYFSNKEINSTIENFKDFVDPHILGCMKDEYPNNEIVRFAALRAKSYAIESIETMNSNLPQNMQYQKKIQNKGIPKFVNSKILHFNLDYDDPRSLFTMIKADYDIKNYAEYARIQSKDHSIYTILQNKIATTNIDLKKMVFNGKYSLPWGNQHAPNRNENNNNEVNFLNYEQALDIFK
jgi:hypothetical protein